jgi:glycosyltransferase involved in cell wall biosynthesis
MAKEAFISVVMPVRNEEALIARSLGAILNQTYPRELVEIIVADGLSNDRTLEIINTLPGKERVRVISNPQQLQAAGLNAAIREARGDIIVRVDGHTIIEPDYIRQCVDVLQETGAANVGGPMNPVGLTPMGQAIASATKMPFAVPSAFHISTKGQYTDTVYLGAWPRRVFDWVGGFDESLPGNEDYEFNYRLRQSGGQIYLSPAIRSHYFGRQTLGALARQYFNYGKAKTSTLKKYPASLRLRQLAAPCFIGAVIGGLPLSVIAPLILWLWLFILLIYLAAALGFSLVAASRAGYTLLWRIPLVFMTIHLAWGAGFWVGWLFGNLRLSRQRTATPYLSLSQDH